MKRVALFIGIDLQGRVLLQHKTVDAPTNANLWVLFGGSLEEGEELKKAVEREMQEELRINIEPHFFKTYLHEESWGTVERNIFYGNVETPVEQLKAVLTEGDDVGFFYYQEVESLPINKNHLGIIDEFFKSGLLKT